MYFKLLAINDLEKPNIEKISLNFNSIETDVNDHVL